MGTSYTHHTRLPSPRFFPNPQLPSTRSLLHHLSLRSLFCSHSPSDPSSPTHTTNNNYNHLIQHLCKHGNLTQALKLLPHEPNPSQRTYESLILSCTHHQNSIFYASTIDRRLLSADGFYHDPFLSTKLIFMYSHFSLLEEARNVFDKTPEKTIFLWNALLKSLAVAEQGEEALSLFREMGRKGIKFDSFSYSYALKACLASSTQVSMMLDGVRQIQAHVIRLGFDSCVHVATTIVDSYARIGKVMFARKVFDEMPQRNVVSWSAMIACYAKNGRHFEALGMFMEMMMRDSEIVPNSVTIVSVLQACAGLAALGQGKLVHGYVLRRGLDAVASVANALIALYVKCGSLDFGRRIFDSMILPRNVVSWNSMISGYGVHGFGKEAVLVFEEMIGAGISPSPITFVSVLGACSHAGLVEEGLRLFESMEKECNLMPQSEHYACMVDLLGRAGRLDEAAKIIEEMEIEPGPTVWGSLLGACRIHGNIEFAERACSHLFELEPWNAGNYVLLADIYAEAKLWDEVKRVKKLLEERGLQKLQGCSWIEAKKKLYSFVSVDELNPKIEQAHALLTQLVKEAKEMGYIPNTKVVLYNLEQEEKEKIVLGHSEKLALAFGLISCGEGEVIRITKNLRLCEDCHSLTKFISKFSNREILVRDVNRFHHFRDGLCSCMDYW